MNAMQNLRNEHGQMMKKFSALQKLLPELEQPDPELFVAVESILEYFNIQIDGCHHGKEEEILFPALDQLQDGTIQDLTAALRADHRTGHRLLEQIRSDYLRLRTNGPPGATNFVADILGYLDHFRRHIRMENAQLLPLMETRLSAQTQEQMAARFQQYEDKILSKNP